MLRVLRVDLSYFFRTKWLIATLVALNLSDMLVVGLIYSHMMSFDYFVFFAPGVVVSAMFAAALDVGRRVYLGLTEGVTQYYLSLPISLNALTWAHLFSAGFGGMIYGGIILAFAVAAVPQLASPAIILFVPLMFVLSMGLGGITAVLNLFSKGGDRYWAFAEGVQTALLGLSTVFYPIQTMQAVLPSPVVGVVLANPLSQAVDALREAVVSSPTLTSVATLQVVVTSLLLMMVGAVAYRYVFAKVREEGKVS
jgi:ABC-type polysaccharide/polyol phosphate export permease